MPPTPDDLIPLIKTIAREEMLPRFNHIEGRLKADGSVVTEADFVVQTRLAEALKQRHPEYELLGEEMDPARQQALTAQADRGLWCLDPVDGTSNFAAGLPFFCVSLALMMGAEPVLGIVYDPIRDECFTAAPGRGAWLNGRRLYCKSPNLPLRRCLALVDFKRLESALAANLMARPPYSSQRYFGSGALEWCWLAASRFHVYLHGQQKPWDYAAGALILAEAGGHSATLNGDPIYAPGLQARSTVAALDADLFAEWQAALAERMAGGEAER
jgi:myo-inositol-1(or 4)-monophosphatase